MPTSTIQVNSTPPPSPVAQKSVEFISATPTPNFAKPKSIKTAAATNLRINSDNESQESTSGAMRRVHAAIVQYTSAHGETEQQFYTRIRSSFADVAAVALASEHFGSTIEEAIQSLDGMNQAIQDPEKVKLLECFGVGPYKPPLPPGHPPSAMECERVKQEFNIHE
jgi:hypothetical protein